MKRHSRGSAFDISIRGDELENNRIQLEHNLQNTELSFHLSSTTDDEDNDGHTPRRRRAHANHHHHHSQHSESVEYPRHISEPDLVDMPSFAHHRSRDHFGDEEHSQMHGWSYRTGDDEEGISPYGGHTASSVAHHASAVTITAGLGGGRTARRDVSLSGAEYDPDRPLHAIMAGVNSKHSMFDADPSKNQLPNNITYDPLVVDSTAELDRLLESGHIPPQAASRSMSVHPTPPTSSVSSDSESAQQNSRPKLADHLRHVSFSPKRPRSAQSGSSHVGSPPPRPSRNLDDRNTSINVPTPRPARRANIFPTYASSPAQPEVRLQPATPSSAGSKFTRMVRGINKELEATQEQLDTKRNAVQPTRPAPAPAPVERNPFHDAENQSTVVPEPRNTRLRRNGLRDSSNGKVHLPDVTGLTSAVESPARPGVGYYPYKGDDRPRDSEVRLLQTLSAVQGQLLDLEEENGISRRRIRELEMELEECKREVARERTRLFEREEQNARSFSYQSRFKGKAKAADAPPELDDERLHARYKEAVEEKKALEALINSLRSHLTRLTSELASHQELLAELRRLRDSDAEALKEKGAEIIQLKEEVQRLAGEVEVLRGVVEEGLKERRTSREIQVENSAADNGMSQDSEEEATEEEEEEDTQQTEEEEESSEEADQAPSQEDASRLNRADRTMRTDIATLGSSHLGGSTNRSPRFVDDDELDNIAAELEERRSNRSNGSIASVTRRSRSPSPIRRKNRATVEEVEDEDRQVQPRNTQPPAQARPVEQPQPSTSRPSAPTPGHAARQYGRARHEPEPEPETPFPQIRGEHLERLFFSAPEHNAKTCTVCYRRRYRADPASPSWSHPKRAGINVRQQVDNQEVPENEDEGYEGSDGPEPARSANKGKQREQVAFSEDPAHWRQAGRTQGLPPQTVVARVIRELEDDFTHYKSIYVELADQYKVMDAVSDVPRRNMLAQHLREVVDILEQKVGVGMMSFVLFVVLTDL
ncbi:hypothetical protein CPB84DRAFT_1773556 [Gymnopilus junonius]|uniref:Cep57 centrosome microtubule-binding domain-containing protein n=1 Tax=Gymnopilus junonius TaxID=109634 RepID=A0A9P5TNY6_GYMJU|nr:hypothetical protein CPB84DRAFT_1773556 [Gymnopilus junonius]